MENTHVIENIQRFFRAPKDQSYFLFGARGTGKSTWTKQYYPDALLLNLLEPEDFRNYLAKPERLRDLLLAYPEKKTIVIDEIQKVPTLLPLIHSILEEKRGFQFVMTGSSARKIKRDGGDLLGGRAALCHMYPFFAAELANLFSLEKALNFGLLPLVWNASNPLVLLRGYAGMYLKEEVQEEGLIRNLGEFARFLEVMSFSHGCLINATNIARECDISRRTVESYLTILDDFLLSFTLPVFTKRAKRELTTHPKFYYFDTGVFRFLRPQGPLDNSQETDGVALEGLIGQHLKAWCDMQLDRHSLSFWRTQSGQEVDFVVYGHRGFWGIEVKNSTKVFPKDLRGIKAFKEEYPEAQTIVVYRGKIPCVIDEILCMPAEKFLLQIHPDQPIFD